MSRTIGSKNVYAYSHTNPSRCVDPGCRSTRRAKYENRTIVPLVTTLPEGLPVSHLIRRGTRCLDCGFPRVDTTYFYSPLGISPDGSEETLQLTDEIKRELIDSCSQTPPELATVAEPIRKPKASGNRASNSKS